MAARVSTTGGLHVWQASAIGLVGAWGIASAQQPVSFAQDIRPILQASCETEPSMPREVPALTPQQVALIKAWIDQGAHWDVAAADAASAQPQQSGALARLENPAIPAAARNYWAFKLPSRPPLSEPSGRFEHPIDRFLDQVRQEKGVGAAPRAAPLTLVRRAYVDLIGLPPTPAETDAFVTDARPGAWEHLIDTLLASPHYGEWWGRHWLDVARYADSSGFEHDVDRPNA